MTNPGDQLPNSPMTNEAFAPFGSAQEYYVSVASGRQYLAGLANSGLLPEAIETHLDEGGPMARHAWESQQVANAFLREATSPPQTGRIFETIVKSKVSSINIIADALSDFYVARLGRSPDMYDVQDATLMMSFAVANATRRSQKPVDFKLESGLVHQFFNALVAKTDPSLLSTGYANLGLNEGTEQRAMEIGTQAARAYQQLTGNTMSEVFIAAKMAGLWISVGNAIAINQIRHSIPETTETADLAEQASANRELAHHIQRIRAYGVKPTIFEFTDVVEGRDAVYHEFSELGESVKGEQPLVLVNLVDANITPLDKVRLTTKEVGGIQGALRALTTEGAPLVMDRNGEIYAGHSPATGSISLRTIFERSGDLDKYEALRAALLSRLFDAVAPATIVERIDATERAARVATDAAEHVSTSPIQRLVLPRIRYLSSMKNMKQLRGEFDEALRAEQTATARMVAYHHIAARLRNLPTGARASETAIQNAKAAYGDDFELPEGKTFVTDYEYGDHAVGEVVGYIAVRSSRASGKDGRGGKNKKNKS